MHEKSKHRWFAFRLRTLLVGMAIAAMGCFLVARLFMDVRQERLLEERKRAQREATINFWDWPSRRPGTGIK